MIEYSRKIEYQVRWGKAVKVIETSWEARPNGNALMMDWIIEENNKHYQDYWLVKGKNDSGNVLIVDLKTNQVVGNAPVVHFLIDKLNELRGKDDETC